MGYVKWTFILLFWAVLGAFLHYTLPQRDIVRVVNTEVRRVDFGENSWFWTNPGTGDADGKVNRDVFFIDTFRPNDRPMVYRNEDTGWGWPPYFKLDSSNLQAEASNLISTKAAPEWVAIRHYGWRFEPMSIFPNAVAIKPVDGPDVRLIPWFNIILLTLLAAVFWAVWVRWRRFREARIDPVIEDIDLAMDEAGQRMRKRGGRLRRFFGGR